LLPWFPGRRSGTAGGCAIAQAAATDQLQTFVTSVKTARGEFTQQQMKGKGADLKVASTSSGTFVFSRPGKFAWRYTKPYEQLLQADGQVLYIYDKDLNQVTERKLDGASGRARRPSCSAAMTCRRTST
jgi:outer membrane lipoprotein carrier protein